MNSNPLTEDDLSELLLRPFLVKKAHSRKRKQQRGCTKITEDIIYHFGKVTPGKGNAQIFQLPRKFPNEVEKAMRYRIIIVEGREATVEIINIGIKKRMKSENQPRPSKSRQDR